MKRYLIIGNQRVGTSVHNLLAKLKIRHSMIKSSKRMVSLDGVEKIIKSPSVPLNDRLIKKAIEQNISIISDIELFYEYNSADIIAVSGTNGKTTVCSLLSHIFEDKYKSYLLGNIGVAACDYALETSEGEVVVLEASSYQLESIEKFAPKIAILTNVSYDHITHHQSYENYIASKQKLFSNQTQKDYAILNFDNDITWQIKDDIKSRIYYFSTKHSVSRGAYLHKNKLYFSDSKKEFICRVKDCKIFGEHNIQNILAAIVACKLYGLNNKQIVSRLKTFDGVEHRLEFVGKVDKKIIINDSKSTNIDSAIVGARAFAQDIVLILGGQDCKENYDILIENLPKNVKHIIITGENQEQIATSCDKLNRSYVVMPDLEFAYQKALSLAKKGNIILFSPASKSFDRFENFEKRGEFFKSLVNNAK